MVQVATNTAKKWGFTGLHWLDDKTRTTIGVPISSLHGCHENEMKARKKMLKGC